jgi:micrococcal nuclease
VIRYVLLLTTFAAATAMTPPTLTKTFLASAVAILCSAAMAVAMEYRGTVVAIPDGEAITVQHDGALETIRLHGVECPDKVRVRARQYLSKLVLGKHITVVALDRDTQGRAIADVFLPDGEMLNGELIRVGLAWTDGMSYAMFSDLEDEARAAKRGMWSNGSRPVAPMKKPARRARRR